MAEISQSTLVNKSHSKQNQKYLLFGAVAILVIFHGVGFWGLVFSNNSSYFQKLTPLNLLLTNSMLFSFHKDWNKKFILFALIVSVAGFMAEVIGVHTGLLFGNYKYGEALGKKLWDVPLLIGLNWLMLVYVTGHIADYIKLPWWIKSLVAALLMVLIDFFIEPAAMKFDFWNWENGAIPIMNYIGWFGLAFLLQLFFQKTSFRKRNKIAQFVYAVQMLFFIGLYIFI